MKTVKVEFDSERGRLRVRGRLFAGSKSAIQFPEGSGSGVRLGLYHFDFRVFEDPPVGVRTSVFPPPGLKCVAMTEREGGVVVLDLNTKEILDIFSDGSRRPGSRVPLAAYVWDSDVPEVLASGFTTVDWSPVYFSADGTELEGGSGCNCKLDYCPEEEALVVTMGVVPVGEQQ